MVARPNDFATIAVTVPRLVIGRGRLRYDTFDLGRDMLHRSCSVEVVGASRLAPTVPLALHDLPADVSMVVDTVLDRLVQMHLSLYVMVLGLVQGALMTMQACHLDILYLGLVDA